MPKDALGHGSNPRGSAGERRATRLANNAVTRAANKLKDSKPSPYAPLYTQTMSGSKPVGYTVHDIGPGGQKTLSASGTMTQGAGGQIVHAKDSVAQDRVAAGALASGPKSAPAPVHEAMRYAPDRPGSNAYQHDYHPESVNEAIKNSGRFGGGKIGGREARMIHAVLKGRGK